MRQPVDDLQRCGLKVFFEPEAKPDVRAFIPIFHRWIQTDAVDGLLIDVADYTHLTDGPAVLLAGHEGNYAIDRTEGRLGLYYHRKRPAAGTLVERLALHARILLAAAVRLESDAEGGACRFAGSELEFVAHDRLRAPPVPATVAALRPHLAALGRVLFGDDAEEVAEPAGMMGSRIRLVLRSRRAVALSELLERVS